MMLWFYAFFIPLRLAIRILCPNREWSHPGRHTPREVNQKISNPNKLKRNINIKN